MSVHSKVTRLVVHPGLTDRTLSPVRYGQEVAQRELHGLYLPEHTHMPVAYEPSDYPQDTELPDRYKRLLDPYIALSFVAATTDIEIGTCVSLVGQHDPIVLAKQVATLDLLAGGRFTLGVGFGWNTREFASHSPVPPLARPDVVREHVELMTSIWTEDIASYSGQHVTLPPSWSWPKPARRPRPPVLLGARPTRRNFERICRWADGWISLSGYLHSPRYPEYLDRLRGAWVECGRSLDQLRIMALEDPEAAPIQASYERAVGLGLDAFILHIEDRPADVALPLLDAAAAALADVQATG
jgi:probable F420-dependent oxidoreductase